jgi:hypothetical protein
MSSVARRHWLFLVILVCHVLLGAAYGLWLPLFESPDEPGHYLYVRHLQAHRQLPVQTEVFEAPRAHHPPLYYALGALLTAAVDIPGSPDAITVTPNPKFGYEQGAPGNDNKAVFVHNGPDEHWPFRGQALAVHLLRLLSLGFSTIAVVATYAAALHLRPGDLSFATLAAGMVAFNPMVLYMSGLVNNDTSALAGGAVVLWLVGRAWPGLLTARLGEWNWLLLGLAFGLSLLLKSSALVLALPISLALAAGFFAQPRPFSRHLARALAVGSPACLIAGWWYWRNFQLYGDLTGNAAVAIVSGRVPPAERWVDLPRKFAWLLQGLYGCGPIGPLSLCLPAPIYLAAAAVALFCLAGLFLVLRRARPDFRQPRTQLWLAHALTLAATTAAVLVYALSYNNTWGGRFFFPAFLSLAVFLSSGALAWIPAISRRSWPHAMSLQPVPTGGRPFGGPSGAVDNRRPLALIGLLLFATLLVPLYALTFQVFPRYAPPRPILPFELSRAAPLNARLGEVAQVVGYRLDPPAVRPGGELAVTVFWRPLVPTPIPYTVFIHLFSPTHGSLAQRDTYPGLGTYPTTGWQPGRLFADTYRLRVSASAPAPDQAYLVLGLYDERTGSRLTASGADAVPEESWIAFGEVLVEP